MKEASLKGPHTMIPTLAFWKRQNHRDSRKISGCQGLVGEGGEGEMGGTGFLAGETPPYGPVVGPI